MRSLKQHVSSVLRENDTISIRNIRGEMFIEISGLDEAVDVNWIVNQLLSAVRRPNQIAEKEIFVRENNIVGVQDGGLDICFYVYTKRFHQKGYLNDEEFHLCERLYSILRLFLPSPDLLIILTAPLAIITERMGKRGRDIDIERSQDLIELEKLIEKWLAKSTSVPSIRIDASQDDPSYSSIIEDLVGDIKIRLNI